jgi:sulfatase modifying factor 1
MVATRPAQRLVAAFALLLVVTGGVACDAILGTLHDRSGDGGAPDALPRADGAPHGDAGRDVDAEGPKKDGASDAPHACPTDACGDAIAPPRSCADASGPGLTDCPAGSGHESCCTSLEVEGGTYDRSYKAGDASFGVCEGGIACDGGTEPGDQAQVSGFRLDKYLVTVGRFRKFRDAFAQDAGLPTAGSGRHTYLNEGRGLASVGTDGGYEPGWDPIDWDISVDPSDTNLACAPDGGGENTWTPTIGGNEDLPIGCANWWEAYAFCIWDGGFLPSEAEWEYAAAGGAEQREYPWGSTDPGPSGEFAIYGNGTATAPVGSASRGIAKWGQLDMAGEAYEWVLDYYAPYVDPCIDCAYLAPQFNRAVRTRHYGPGTAFLTPPYRNADLSSPMARNFSFGFRCARKP